MKPYGADGLLYDRTTIRLHWATVLLVVLLWLMGQLIGFMERGPLRVDAWSLHIVLGVLLTLVLAARIVWRLARGRHLPPADRGALQVLAKAVHWLLYALLGAVLALGIANALARGFPLFNDWPLPKVGDGSNAHDLTEWHALIANIVMGLALLHALAALAHHYLVGDEVLIRMWPSLATRQKT